MKSTRTNPLFCAFKNAVFFLLFLHPSLYAQAPQQFSYQAVIRDSQGELVTSSPIGLQISIQRFVFGLPPSYQDMYVETHQVNSNENGLVTLKVGLGQKVSGDFSAIDWGAGNYFLRTAIDIQGGTNYTIYGRTQFLSVPYALYAGQAENVVKYKVGDFAHGGIVFWVDETGQHGLVCAKTDQSTGMRWHAGTNGTTHATGDGIYAGKSNTSIIIAAQVAIGDDGETFAARLCNELIVTEDGVNYGDWYLPSRQELILMAENQTVINSTALLNNGTSFAVSEVYWSSTETEKVGAANVLFKSDSYAIHSYYKDVLCHVRAIRSF